PSETPRDRRWQKRAFHRARRTLVSPRRMRTQTPSAESGAVVLNARAGACPSTRKAPAHAQHGVAYRASNASMKELVLAVILSFPRGPAANETQYLETVAEDIASVVQDEGAPPAFDGPAAKEATAVLLAAIAAHESGFAHDVDDCRRRGDGG